MQQLEAGGGRGSVRGAGAAQGREDGAEEAEGDGRGWVGATGPDLSPGSG